jgi:hypothetical protein
VTTLVLLLFAFTFAHRAFWAAAILALPAVDILPRVPFCFVYVAPKAESAAAIALTSFVKRSCSFFKILTTPLRLVIKSPSRGIVTGGPGNECNGDGSPLNERANTHYEIQFVPALFTIHLSRVLTAVNEMFSRGTLGGGMGPGTSWEPFTVSEDEYAALVEAIQDTALEEVKPHARFAFVKFKFDHSLDGIETWYGWVSACCKKHRESFHRELRDAGATS